MGIKAILRDYVLKQYRAPTGLVGKYVARRMETEHEELRAWGLGLLTVPDDATILDVGCGGGDVVLDLAQRHAQAKIRGVDISATMVRTSRAKNRSFVKNGRVEISRATVSSLPYPDESLDLVTAFETSYFWPDLVEGLREIRRVLKPGGQIAIVNEMYEDPAFSHRNAKTAELVGIEFPTPEQYRELLQGVGFTVTGIETVPSRNWVCAIGRNPEAEPAG